MRNSVRDGEEGWYGSSFLRLKKYDKEKKRKNMETAFHLDIS